MGSNISLFQRTQQFNDNSLTSRSTYYGPHFVMDDENISTTSSRAFVEDILNVLSLGILGNLHEVAALGNLYNELPPPPLRKAKTLQSKINLSKSSIQVLHRNKSTEIQFKYDSLVPCYISIYYNARVTYESNTDASLKFNMLTENEKPAACTRYGPFPGGLNQIFTTTEDFQHVFHSHETVANVPVNIQPQTVAPVTPGSANETNPLLNRPDNNIPPPISITLPTTAQPEIVSPSSINPSALYDIIIVLEEQDPSVSHDFQNPYMNAQATSLMLKRSDIYEIVYSKQSLLVDGIPYTLQEVYGFSESETDNRNDQGYNKLSHKFATSALRNTCNVSGSLFTSSLTVASGFANCAAIAAVPIINHTPYLATITRTNSGKIRDVSDLRDTIISTTGKLLNALPFSGKFVNGQTSYNPHEKKAAEDSYLNGFHVYSSGALSEDISFSFSGCGWLIFYELGVAQCLKDTIKPEVLRKAKFLGSSTGSIIALSLALDLDLELIRESLMELVQESSGNLLSPFVAISNIIRPLLEKVVRSSIDLCQERLFVSLTELPSGKNVLVSEFSSRTDLINNIIISCSLPVFSNNISLKDQLYISGDLSGRIPILDEMTITASPYHDSANISPSNQNYTKTDECCPRSNMQIYNSMFEGGWKDTYGWLTEKKSSGVLTGLIF
ncbi:hypothetical protein HDV01_005874 [Terramyces sp. JEL0728]|nr:hypothetical protein HDV01_005874 [Terramyces sp. JEL0728]